MTDPVPRDVITATLDEAMVRRPDDMACHLLNRLDEAEFAIVRKSTGDRVAAALEAFTHAVWHRQPQLYAWEFPAQPMEAALAAADAADGRVTVDPDDAVTVERVAQAIHAGDTNALHNWQGSSHAQYRKWARAVLAALRDGGR